MEKEEFLEALFNQQRTNQAGLPVLLIKEIEDMNDRSIIEILGLRKNRLSEEAMIVIDILESEGDFPYVKFYHKLKWKLLALYNIQDAFSGMVHLNDYSQEVYFAQHYFYFEALHLLREYFYCGFNNFLSAADHLLRTFVEFNLKQCYYSDICQKEGSYSKLKQYLKTGISPSNPTMINSYFPKAGFCKPIKKKIQVILSQLSHTSSHAYAPSNSSRGQGSMHHEYSLDSMYFWMALHQTIDAVLWSYYILNPNIFYPKDILKKFGFNYPLGTYVSEFQFLSVKQSLSEEDFREFINYAEKTQLVKDLEDFYNSQNDKSESEIRESWTEEETLEDFEIGYLMQIAKQRALYEMVASMCTIEGKNKPVTEAQERMMEENLDYSWWKKNYKKI